MPPKTSQRKASVVKNATQPIVSASRPLSTVVKSPPPQSAAVDVPAIPRSPDITSMGGDVSRAGSAANPSSRGLESFQAFSHRRVELSVGHRMARLRKEKGITISAVVSAARLGMAAQYEAVEAGTSAMERWAAVLGRFAVNLEIPVQELFPLNATALASSVNGVQQADASVEGGSDSLPASAHLGYSGGGSISHVGACGMRLLQVRSEKGMSMDSVCAGTGISLTEYRQIERGESSSGYEKWVWVLARFCRLLNISPFLLVAGLPVEGADETDSDDDIAVSTVSSDLIIGL